jgi:hypothetical protein
VEDLVWVKLLQDGVRLLLLLWDGALPALWGFLRENSQALNHLALIAIGAIGLPLLWIRTRAADRQAAAANKHAEAANEQARTAEQGHITDRFTSAIEQLGSEKMAVRLGAIYALERLSRDSPDDHGTIMEVLTAYVRDNAPWPPTEAPGNPFVELQTDSENPAYHFMHGKPAADIQAILTVLGRRDETAREQELKLDLCHANLRRAVLREAHFEGANLLLTRLEGASLHGAHLERAFLVWAHLESAGLVDAHLQGAVLCGAHLQGALLVAARLQGATLSKANLSKAHLERANLSTAIDLTQEQVNSAFGDEHTVLPEGLTRPAQWLRPEYDPPPPTPPPRPEPPPDPSR